MKVEVLNKLEVSDRQLKAAVRMLFRNDDAVAVHTVTAAAYQVLSDLCLKQGIQRGFEDLPILDQLGIKEELIRFVRRPQNFFKHADRDADETIEFKWELTVVLLMLATVLHQELTRDLLWEVRVFRYWFWLKYPEFTPLEWRSHFEQITTKPDANDLPFFLEFLAHVR